MRHILESTAALGIVTPAISVGQERETSNAEQRWRPHFFEAEQNDTLIALGECIILGSSEANCNRLIDTVALIESKKNKSDLLNALAAFDAEAQRS